eukprot:4915069-Alexandrium_andersonii.AAC.1
MCFRPGFAPLPFSSRSVAAPKQNVRALSRSRRQGRHNEKEPGKVSTPGETGHTIEGSISHGMA